MSILIVIKAMYLLLDFLGGGFFDQEVLFESKESKTQGGSEVFNKISFKKLPNKDIWTMKQSHNGIHANEWDEIKIVVDTSSKPHKASFHQLKAGKEVEYKTSCFRCHSGGPRLVRPVWDSKEAPLNIKEKLVISKWNLRIKSYGDVHIKNNNPFKRMVPLIKDQNMKKHVLNLESCSKCHYQGGPRAPITKANATTAKFLVKNKMMPPWPYEISKREKAHLKEFLYGL